MGDESWTPGNHRPARPDAGHPPPLSRFAHRRGEIGAPATPPASPAAEPKLSFWRRIAQTRTPETTPATSALLERIRALESRLAAAQAVNDERLARSERALDDLHRQGQDPAVVELRTRLSGLEVDQTEAEEALVRAVRGLKWLVGAVAALALALAGAILFGVLS